MKKVFTLAAALMLAFSAIAENVYFKTTAATSWWANDGAKIGALFKVGTDPLDFGMYAQFFTLVPGTTDTYVGTVPENEEPFVAVQFLRYNSAATDPEEMNYWNATGLETWDGVNDMFTATASGDTWDSTTGKWSKYNPTPGPTGDKIYLDCESFDADNNWNQAGAQMGVMFTDGTTSEYTDFMSYDSTKKLFYASIPEGEWTACIFMRYSNTATQTGWADFWNRSCEVSYDGSDNLYTIADWDGCTDTRDAANHSDGEWSTAPTAADEAEADAAVKVQKIMINGAIFLVAGDKTYNLLGVEVK